MSADQTAWYYLKGSVPTGPVRSEVLRMAVEAGDIPSSTLVWCHGLEKWTPVKESPLPALPKGTVSPFQPGEALAGVPAAADATSPAPPWPPVPVQSAPPMPVAPEIPAEPPELAEPEPVAWYESRRWFWQWQRTVSAMIMIAAAVAIATAQAEGEIRLNLNGLLLAVALVAGWLAFTATRQLDVVTHYESDGLIRLSLKASLRTLASAIGYALIIGGLTAYLGTNFSFGFGTGLGITSIAYILTVHATYRAVNACRIESIAALKAQWAEPH